MPSEWREGGETLRAKRFLLLARTLCCKRSTGDAVASGEKNETAERGCQKGENCLIRSATERSDASRGFSLWAY